MRKSIHLLIAVLTLMVLSTGSTHADWGSRSVGWFGSWGGFFGWGHHGFRGHNNRGWHRWGKRGHNNGNNGCERSNFRSRSCEQNPNTTFYCILWTDTEVRHPETFESAYTSGDIIWALGDEVVFESGATCLVDEVPEPTGRG